MIVEALAIHGKDLRELSRDISKVSIVFSRVREKLAGAFDALIQLGVLFALRKVVQNTL